MKFDNIFNNIYNNRRIFLTGHTGFKGSWLTTWLLKLQAKVRGYSLGITGNPNHFSLLKNDIDDCRGNIRNFEQLYQCLREFEPEIVFHLAAQPIVRISYDDPLNTFDTNIMGTANLLEACRRVSAVRAVIVVTTDKCYENKEWIWGYRENDPLGGHDPYSASKACAEIITASFRNLFSQQNLLVASCRAGNVIGGGDWASDRLIPDLIRAATENIATTIRMPDARRPWLHVLEPLYGYLLLGQKLLESRKEFAEAWNFGSGNGSDFTVKNMVSLATQYWNKIKDNIVINNDNNDNNNNNNNNNDSKHETTLLTLDSSKAQLRLAWKPQWTLEESVERTITWYRNFYEQKQIQTLNQIEEYSELLL
ncbi:MAG: CDP-glucose 4,6-dehydratase [Planctomycetaceae bacterium]|nr:CDP-glucose 4,6-dehydratase [Planctomycetaceae bacterium]